MIILVGGEKGGTGKTTIATNLAARLKDPGADVLLVDTDKQGSASSWAAMREEQKEVWPNFQYNHSLVRGRGLFLNFLIQNI